MSKQKAFVTVFFVLALLGALSLTACQSASPAQAMTAPLEEEVSKASAEFNYEQAAEHMADRWTAKAQAYEKDDLTAKQKAPGDVVTQRWNAMAKAYEGQGSRSQGPTLDEVIVARWQAMGRAYEQSGQ